MNSSPKSAAFEPLSSEEEEEVINALKAGNREALSTLYRWYGDPLYRQAILPRLPVLELAEDVLAQCFARAMERIHQFQPDGKSIFFWMRRIGRLSRFS